MSLIYDKTEWKDDKSTPVNAKNLNNIEDGIEYIYHKWDRIIQDSTTGDHAAELIDARYSPNDKEDHPTLGHRLNHMDDKYKDISSQLAQNTNKLNGVISIDEYSHMVINDDWSNAINRAIQDAYELKCKLIFGNNIYSISSPIIIDKKVLIEGCGNTTILKKGDFIGIHILTNSVVIRDFIVTCDYPNDTHAGIKIGHYERGVVKHKASKVKLNNIESNGHGGDGIYLAVGNGCTLDVSCSYNKQNGLRIDSEDTEVQDVNDNLIFVNALANKLNGMYIRRAHTNKIQHCLSQGNTGYGIYFYNADSNIVKYYCEGNIEGGIKCDGVTTKNILQGKTVNNDLDTMSSTGIDQQPYNVIFNQDNSKGMQVSILSTKYMGLSVVEKINRGPYTIPAKSSIQGNFTLNLTDNKTDVTVVANCMGVLPDGVYLQGIARDNQNKTLYKLCLYNTTENTITVPAMDWIFRTY